MFSETSALDVGACGGLECLLVRDCLGAGECVVVSSVFWGLECVSLGVECVSSSAVCWSRSMFRCLSVFVQECVLCGGNVCFGWMSVGEGVNVGQQCVLAESVWWFEGCFGA